MAVVRIDKNKNSTSNVYYEYDPSTTPLGCGGMGRVYKGKSFDKKNGISRDIAIKCLYEDLPSNVIARAKREASIRLRNDSLIEMLDYIEVISNDYLGSTTPSCYVISEYIDGISLDDFMSGNLKNSEGNTSSEIEKLYTLYKNDSCEFALNVVHKVLAGIMALHDAGYIHRDIDPSNIMITSTGNIKLIDFGIAKKIDTINTKDKQSTVSGQIIGKPFYAAPELVIGDIKNHNYTTDTYAIGILLFHLITGHVPFKGAIHEVIEKQLHSPVPVKEVKHKGVRKVIAKATNKRQSHRYKSAAEFRVAIESIDYTNASSILNTKSIIWSIVTVMLIAFGTYAITDSLGLWDDDPKPINDIVIDDDEFCYEQAVDFLNSADNHSKGVEILDSLSENKDFRATFLLSRLYYTKKHDSDLELLDLGIDWDQEFVTKNNVIAHDMLVKAISFENQDYRAWYELGCDYMSNDRGVQRSPQYAKYCFERALEILVSVKINTPEVEAYKEKINERLNDQLNNLDSVEPKELSYSHLDSTMHPVS